MYSATYIGVSCHGFVRFLYSYYIISISFENKTVALVKRKEIAFIRPLFEWTLAQSNHTAKLRPFGFLLSPRPPGCISMPTCTSACCSGKSATHSLKSNPLSRKPTSLHLQTEPVSIQHISIQSWASSSRNRGALQGLGNDFTGP